MTPFLRKMDLLSLLVTLETASEVELWPNLHMHGENWPENGTRGRNLVEIISRFRKLGSWS
jgi:hypothetical protein